MRVGIIQPNYIPWRGYFDFIASVDVFIVLDDVQYTVRDWRNRNRIKTPAGLRWLSVPVKQSRGDLICEVRIDEASRWRDDHLNAMRQNYEKCPHYAKYFDLFRTCLDARDA